MPRAIDLASSVNRSATGQNGVSRGSRTIEPAARFDRVLDRQSRTATTSEPSTPSQSTDAPAKPTEAADKPDKAEVDPKSKKIEVDQNGEIEVTDDDDDATASPVLQGEVDAEPDDSDAPDQLLDLVVDEDNEPKNEALDHEDVDIVQTVTQAQVSGAGAVASDPSQAVAPQDRVATDPANDAGNLTKAGAVSVNAPVKPINAGPSTEVESDTQTPAQANAPVASVLSSGTEQQGTQQDADAEDASMAMKNPSHAIKEGAPAGAFVLPSDVVDAGSTEAQSASVVKVAPPTPAGMVQPVAPQQPEQRFAESNVDRIVSHVKSDLTPGGGSMKIRLDPPRLGQLQIDVTVDDGILTASFRTTNDEATRLLSHSISQLKTSLEQAGLSVDRIQVRQASPGEQASSNRQSSDQDQQQQQHNNRDTPDRQEQQRREMIQRMWAKLGVGEAPLDLVA